MDPSTTPTFDSSLCNVALLSIGRLTPSWTPDLHEGLVYATDPATLGEGATVETLAIVNPLDDDGVPTDDIWLISGGQAVHYADSHNPFDAMTKAMSTLKPWERGTVQEFIREAISQAPDFYLDEDEGKMTVGQMGEIRIDDENEALLAPGALVFNATIFPSVEVTLDANATFGVTFLNSEAEPEDASELCAVIWPPSETLLANAIQEAEEYRSDMEGAVNLYLNLLVKWQSVDAPALRQVWNLVLKHLPQDTYVPSHTTAARIAYQMVGDAALGRTLLDRAKQLPQNHPNEVSYFFMAWTVMRELAALDATGNRAEILDMLAKAFEEVSLTDPSEVVHLLQGTASSSGGFGLNDKKLAKQYWETVSARLPDSKTRTKFKKAVEKSINLDN